MRPWAGYAILYSFPHHRLGGTVAPWVLGVLGGWIAAGRRLGGNRLTGLERVHLTLYFQGQASVQVGELRLASQL